MTDKKQARPEEAQALADLQRALVENQAVAFHLRKYLVFLQEKAAERYDAAENWAESCRIQGERRLIKQIYRVVGDATQFIF
jgi:hypothetical protein